VHRRTATARGMGNMDIRHVHREVLGKQMRSAAVSTGCIRDMTPMAEGEDRTGF
jgi:hypothetical protein